MNSPSLLSIIAYARSGALEHAWRLFAEAGLDRVNDDAAVLSVRGRLLKDRALGAQGAERKRLYLESAKAYGRASELGGATYPLINAATLSLLAGQRERAEILAREVLEKAQLDNDEPETPYYRAATRAEAQLLLGDVAQAKAAFGEAVALAPKAFEDHATTLRQFGLILDALGEDNAWLDACRPPRSLHFAGHMAPANGGTIRQRVLDAIREERIGFGYGALAAGSDILIAEALLESGAELHLALPCSSTVFRETSVAHFGDDWAQRFDRILEAADSIWSMPKYGDALSPLALQLAAEVAMGRAVMQAEVLSTEAVQLLILERSPSNGLAAGSSGWIGSIWKKSGRRQHVLMAPRAKSPDHRSAAHGAEPNCLAAMLRIEPCSVDADRLATDILPALARALAAAPEPLIAPRWTGDAVLIAFELPARATAAAMAVSAALDVVMELRIAGHYAIVRRVHDPFGGEPLLLGSATTMLEHIAAGTPPGAIHVSQDFAAALCVEPATGRPRLEYVGETAADDSDGPRQLFSLKH